MSESQDFPVEKSCRCLHITFIDLFGCGRVMGLFGFFSLYATEKEDEKVKSIVD